MHSIPLMCAQYETFIIDHVCAILNATANGLHDQTSEIVYSVRAMLDIIYSARSIIA